MGKAQKKAFFWKNGGNLIKNQNEDMKRQIEYLKKSWIQEKKKENNSTTENVFDKYGNEVSQIETVNEVDDQTIKKYHVISLLRYIKNSLLAGNDDNVDNINYLQTIEAGVTKKRKTGQLKYDDVYLLNNMKYNLQDKLLEKVLDDKKKENKNIAKVLLLNIELQEKNKAIENMKDIIDEKMNNNQK